jgi:hypothetical protein
VLGTAESADGCHSGSRGEMWHAHVHGPRRLATSVGATDQQHGCEGSLLTGAQPTSEGVLLTMHVTTPAVPETIWLRIIPPRPGGVGWSHDAHPLHLSPPSPFALFHSDQSRLGVTADRQSCRIAACREPAGNISTFHEESEAVGSQNTECNGPSSGTER